MGKQQFPKVLIDGLSLRVYKFDRNVFQGQPLHFRAVVPLLDQRDERTGRLYDRMPDRLRHGVAAAGRAGRGVGQAAGRENDTVCGHGTLRRFYAGHAAIGNGDLRRFARQDTHMVCAQEPFERIQNGLRPVRDRKNAVAALGLERAAVVFKEFLCVCGRKAREGAVEKARVRRDALQHILPRAVVRDVAAALAGDEKLFAEPAVLLQQRHLRARLRGHTGGHHARRAAADNDNFIRPAQRRHIHPKSAPDPHRFLPRCPPAASRRRRSAR